MSVMSSVRRLSGFAEVEETNKEIIITGIAARALHDDIQKVWATSKIAANMFTKLTWSEVRIPKFFALEFEYIVQRLIESPRLNSKKRVLKLLLDQLRENTWIRNVESTPTPWFNWSKINKAFIYDSLLPHQMEFLKQYESRVPRYGLKGMLLAASAGLGKTLTGIALSLCVEAEKVIIVCPKNASIRVWKKTLETEMRVPQTPYVAEIERNIQPGRKYHIFHYEALDRAIELAKAIRGQKVCILLDESHNLNEIKSARTERFIELCRITNAPDIVWASGTPVKAMGFETIPLLKTIDPLFTDRAELAFRKMYGRDAKRTLDILAHRLGIVTHVVPKANVMSDKPEFEQIRVTLPHADKYTLTSITALMGEFIKERAEYYKRNKEVFRKIYDDVISTYRKTLSTEQQLADFKKYQQTISYLIKNGFDATRDGDLAVFTNRYEKECILPTIRDSETRKAFINAKSVVKYVALKIRGECLGRILTRERIQCHLDMLPYIPWDDLIRGVKKKTIVFTSYVKAVDETFNLLSKKGYSPLRVYGSTNNELANIVQRFDRDVNLNPLIATFQSLSTAVPLTMANGIIFLNNPWRSYEKEQAVARAHRIGQDQTVYCFDVILDTGDIPNISSRTLDVMEWSKSQVDKIMGIKGDTTVSIEENGFITPDQVVDYNEVLDDVLISKRYRGPYATTEVMDTTPSYDQVTQSTLYRRYQKKH